MSCESFRDDLLLNAADGDSNLDLEIHLESCVSCRRELAELRDLYRSLADMDPEREALTRARARLDRELVRRPRRIADFAPLAFAAGLLLSFRLLWGFAGSTGDVLPTLETPAVVRDAISSLDSKEWDWSLPEIWVDDESR